MTHSRPVAAHGGSHTVFGAAPEPIHRIPPIREEVLWQRSRSSHVSG